MSKIEKALEICIEREQEIIRLKDKMADAKHEVLRLLESSGMTNYTKQRIRDELMDIYKRLK